MLFKEIGPIRGIPLNVMKEYGIQDGHYTNIFCGKKDEGRIKECFRKQRVKRLEKGIDLEIHEKGFDIKIKL